MSAEANMTIRLRVICINPLPPVYGGQPAEFGLQDKAGALTLGQPLPDGALCFEGDVQVRADAERLNFLGPYAHGTAAERFLYLSYRHHPSAPWIRRIKVLLGEITAEQIAACSDGQHALEVTVDGRFSARARFIGGGWRVALLNRE